jgi:diguanylate cyclase (GGDEF)-like protein
MSIGAGMYGMWGYERDRLTDISHAEAMRAGRVVEKALRGSMLNNDRAAIQQAIEEISQIVEPPSQISIVSYSGSVSFSSDTSLIGRRFDRNTDPTCSVCHLKKGVRPQRSAVMLDTATGPVFRNVIKIVNSEECYGCHDSGKKNLGVLLYDARLNDIYAMLNVVALRTLLTGLGTFLVIFIVFLYLANRFIHKPIKELMKGFYQVGTGNFSHWVDIDGSGEFSEMADSFNIMSRAIGRYINEIKERSRETAFLYAVVDRISKTIQLKELVTIVFDLFHEFFEYEEIMLVYAEGNRDECYAITWRRHDSSRLHYGRYFRRDKNVPGASLRREELEQWLTGEITVPKYVDDDNRGVIPLFYSESRIGLISVRREGGRSFTRQQKKLIGALAHHVAISLANATLYHQATTDSLTGLFTKRYFQEILDTISAETLDKGERCWIMMIDLDHFKEVNDTYGHPAGDEVLRQLADLIRDSIRFRDVSCRYGGEEFIVLLPEVSIHNNTAYDIAERFLRVVREHVFSCPGCPPINQTVSIGIAALPDHGRTWDEVIQAADDALYEAKRGGRDRLCCASERSKAESDG